MLSEILLIAANEHFLRPSNEHFLIYIHTLQVWTERSSKTPKQKKTEAGYFSNTLFSAGFMNTRKTLPLLENIGRQKSILTGLILGKIYELN